MRKGILSCLLLLLLCLPVRAAADSEFNFSVQFALPENQVDQDKTYLDLMVEPGSEQAVDYTIRNDTENDLTITVAVHPATTNGNGVIEYARTPEFTDDSLQHNLVDLVSYEKELVVPKQSIIQQQLIITAPDEAFTGIIAGGITFQEKNTSSVSETNGVGVTSTFSMTKAILLRNKSEAVSPELKLKRVSPELVNARSIIQAIIQNDHPAYLFDSTFDITLEKSGTAEPFYETTVENISIAPNSTFGYRIPLDGKTLEAGNYTLSIQVAGAEKEWHLEKDFQVSASQSERLAAEDVDIQEKTTDSSGYIFLGWGLVLLLMFLIGKFIIAKNKGEK